MGNDIILAGNLIEIIESSRKNALRKVNEELIRMYWLVGEYLSVESKNVSFGDKYIANFPCFSYSNQNAPSITCCE